MIKKILLGIFSLITQFIGLLLTPINNAINQFIPGFSSALNGLANVLNIASQFIGWILDSLLLNSETIAFIVAVWVFKLSFPYVVYLIKLVVQWYNNLKV